MSSWDTVSAVVQFSSILCGVIVVIVYELDYDMSYVDAYVCYPDNLV